eukprot:3780097-Pleurochrysis_carterae.AAC.3
MESVPTPSRTHAQSDLEPYPDLSLSAVIRPNVFKVSLCSPALENRDQLADRLHHLRRLRHHRAAAAQARRSDGRLEKRRALGHTAAR